MKRRPGSGEPGLVRGLGAGDAALVTIGSVLGTGIFITTGDIARAIPHPGLILLVWAIGGVLTLAGALTYAELGALYPLAGGQYHFLKEAYGPMSAFLFGWVAFLVIMTGGIAALAVGFGEYLGAFLPFFSTSNALLKVPIGPWSWSLSGGQLAGTMAIAFLSALNYVGLRAGATAQNVVTVIKIGSIMGLAGFGLGAPALVEPKWTASLPPGNVLPALGVGMIAVLWSFDGWYAVTNLAGEMRRPEKSLPLGLIGGTVAVTLLYMLMNLVYIRTLPVAAMRETTHIGATAAVALFGPLGGRIITVAVLISTFGCMSSTILYAARIYLPMAQDGVFFQPLARIHPRYLTPAACIAAQGLWAIALTCSGTYEQLYTYVTFAVVLFHAATGSAVFVLRRRRPEAPRPYRTWGYPWVPALFVLTSLLLVVNTLVRKPIESAIGLFLLILGLPVYLWRRWRGRSSGEMEVSL